MQRRRETYRKIKEGDIQENRERRNEGYMKGGINTGK